MSNIDWESVSIPTLAPDVPLKYLPSRFQIRHFGEYVDFSLGADPDGNFNGRCPISQGAHSAVFNFYKGVMKCEGDPVCHLGKRAISLVNTQAAMRSHEE